MERVSSQQSNQTKTSIVTEAADRLRAIYGQLLGTYGPQQWWPAKTPLEVIVGAYLTQNTAWTSVKKSLRDLDAAGLLTVEGLRVVSEDELRAFIRPSGYMKRKAAAIKAFIKFLDRFYNGSLEKLAEESPDVGRERLLALSGVGPETADAILLYALGQPAMVVDEYLRRVVTRHGLLSEASKYEEIQRLAELAFKGDSPATLTQHYNEFHAVIVQVGKSHCGRVPKCEDCPLRFDLPRLVDGSSPAKTRRRSRGRNKTRRMITFYAATSNPGKLRDFAAAAKEENGLAILPLPNLETIAPPAEQEASFAGNASAKAAYYSRFLPGEVVIADDSGLEVEALGGEPGVRSARYAADAGFVGYPAASTDERNNLYLLTRLKDAPASQRSARYRCVLAAAREGECLLTAEGSVEGEILAGLRGTGGFGYDPLFYLPQLGKTMAEIDLPTKHRLSHRGQAMRNLVTSMFHS
jgi:endonuclease III related protein